MVPREDRLIALAMVLAALACTSEGVMDLTCKIKKRQSAPMLGLSSNAMNSIYYKGSQTSSSFQVLDCTCEGNEDENLQFADRDSDELEDDEKFVKENQHDWKDSAVLHIHDCRILEVSLVNDDDRSFAALLDRAAIILENIEELSLLKFDIGLKGIGDNDNEEAVMIIQRYQ